MDPKGIKEWWIGDAVRVIKTNEVGKFEGVLHGQARVLLNGQHMLFDPSALEIYEEKEADESLNQLLGIPEDKPVAKIKFANELDLHLEKLGGYSPQSGIPILDYQLNQTRLFLEKIISRKIGFATIIHGKGEGILRDQVIHLLGEFPQIKQHYPKNGGGALEILLYY